MGAEGTPAMSSRMVKCQHCIHLSKAVTWDDIKWKWDEANSNKNLGLPSWDPTWGEIQH